ncbi:MAG: pilus assembly protein [Oscillospiraceae bacterium]|nr:pilus assembly protein [Oscillospiraceae bacterium]
MINIKQRLEKDGESGEIMLEAAIVLLMVFTIIFAMFSLGFMYYQKVMVQTIANEAASYAATNYKYILTKNGTEMDIDANDVTIFDSAQGDTDDEYVPAPLKMFRSSFSISAFEREGKSDVEAYVEERMNLSSFGINDSVSVDEYDITVDNIGRMHVDCTISAESEIIFAGFAEFLGIIDDSTITFSASSRAEIIDITSYASYVNFVGYFGRVVSQSEAIESVTGSVYTISDSVKETFNALINFLNG